MGRLHYDRRRFRHASAADRGLAAFWDSHDLTDFADGLEEVSEPVFARAKGTSLRVELQPSEAQHLKEVARSKGLKETAIVRQWILETLHRFSSMPSRPGSALQPRARAAAADEVASLAPLRDFEGPARFELAAGTLNSIVKLELCLRGALRSRRQR